jgi:hypothetical protein
MVDFSLSGLGVAEDELDKFSITERTPTPQTVPPPEDFSSTALGGEFDAPQSVAAGFLANAPVSSDAYAKARNLAKKLNLPVILGEREPQRLRSEDIVSQAQKLLERHPGLSAFLRDPDNQKLVGDDLDTLSRISVLMTALETREEAVGAKEFLGEFPEYIAKSFGSLGASAKQFYIQSGIANAMVGAMAAKTNMDLAMTRSVFAALGADEVAAAIPALDPARFAVDPKGPEAKAAAEYGKKYRAELQYIFQRATGGDYWSEIALGGTTSLVMMGAAIAAGSITGGSTLGIMGSMAFVNRFGEAMDRGFSVGAASAEAVFFATLEVVSERIPLKLILGNKAKGLESLKGQIPGLLKAMGAESLQEVFIDAVDKGYDKLVLDKTTTWPEVFRSLSQAGIIGAGVGGTLRGGMMGLNKVASVIMPDPGAGAYEQALMAIKAEVDGAKTQTRDPAVMKAALEGMADGAEVFISANELLELEQNEELTFAQLEEAGLSTDTIEAMQLGGDVKLSVSELLALRPEIFALLSPSVRRTINSDTVREADQKLQERDQTIDRLLADMQAQLDEDASARPIHSTVSEQLRSTGKYNDAQVDRMADLVAESYETRAANTTKTAEELFLDDHVSIRTGRATPDGARGQATALTQEGGFAAYRNIVDPEGRTIPAEDRPNLRMGDMYGMLPKDAEVVGELDDVTLHRGANGDYYATAYNADLGEQDVVGYIQGRENGTELAVVEEMQGKGIGSELQYLFRRENPLAPTGGLTEAGASRLESTYDRLAAEYMDPLEQQVSLFQEDANEQLNASSNLDDAQSDVIARIESAGGEVLEFTQVDGLVDLDQVPVLTLQDLEGMRIFPTVADRTAAAALYTGVEGAELDVAIPLLGGPLFPLRVSNWANNVVWANRGASVTKAKEGKITEGKATHMLVVLGDPNMHISNTTVTTAYFKTLLAALQNPENKFDADAARAFTDLLQTWEGAELIEPQRADYKTDEAFKKANKNYRDNLNIRAGINGFPGFSDPAAIIDHLHKISFEARKKIMQIAGSKKASDITGVNMQKLLNATREQSLSGAGWGDGVLLLEIDTENTFVELGQGGTTKHPDFPLGIRGKVAGRFETPISWQLLWRDYVEQNSDKDNVRRAFELARPIVEVTPELLQRMENMGSLASPGIETRTHAAMVSDAVARRWSRGGVAVKDGGLGAAEFMDAMGIATDGLINKLRETATGKTGLNAAIKSGDVVIAKLGKHHVYYGMERVGDDMQLSSLVNNESGTYGIGEALAVLDALDNGATTAVADPSSVTYNILRDLGFDPDGDVLRWNGDSNARGSLTERYIGGRLKDVLGGRSAENVRELAGRARSQSTVDAGGRGKVRPEDVERDPSVTGADGATSRARAIAERISGLSSLALENLGLTEQDQANVAALTGRPLLLYQDAPDISSRLEEAAFPTNDVVADLLGGFPSYLVDVAGFMLKQRQKLLSGTMTPRDVIKAYAITVGSQGAGAMKVETFTQKTGFTPDPAFVERNMIRPEEAMAMWFGTDAGQAALAEVDAGVYNHASWQELFAWRRAWGDNRLERAFSKEEVRAKRTGNLTAGGAASIFEITEEVNRAKDAVDTPAALMDTLTKLSSVAVAKGPFMSHLLGIGDTPTMDAVEINFWLTGQADVSRLAAEVKRLAQDVAKSGAAKQQLRDIVADRFNDLVLSGAVKVPESIDKGVFQHIMHHWLWDRAKGIETTHSGLYKAMEFYQQQKGVTARGSFQQERDTYGNLENIITLMENADLSTFLHEGGHFWLFQMQRDLNSDYLTEQGRARLQKQWDNTTAWFQQNSKQAWSDIQKMAKSARRRATANPDDAVMQDRAARLEAAVSRAKRGNGDIYMAEVAANFMNGSVENGTDLEVAFHELWARGAEKYLGEGKAPSAALRPAFASFSAWMTSIYKNLKNLNVTLDDNIRGVFDRLLATEEAIYAEKQRDAYKIPRDVRALANDAELAELGQLVREAELEAQQELQAAVADEISQFNRQEYKAAEAEATEQITKEVYSDPLYAAIELSRNGVTRDGTQLTDPDGKPSKMQMPRDEFVALFGVDAARAMPRGLLTKNVDTAIDVATFTMLSGFDSQDAMVAAMTTPHPRAAELIKQRVAERMGDEYSSLTDPGVAADRAAGIVANEKQVELAELQARILRRKTSEVLRGAAQRRALEEGAPSAVSDRERTEDIARASGAAPTAADAVPEQLSAAASEAQRQANIPQRKAQSAARRQVSQMMASFDIEGIKQAAKMFVGRAKVRDLTPQRYIAAADRLARKANKAIAGRDYAAAATLLEQKALNLAIAKEAGAAQTKVSRTVQRLRERSERSDKKLSKYRDLKIFNAARFILSSVGINRNPPPDLAGVLVEAQSALDEAPHKELEDTLNAVVSELAPYTQDGAADYRNLPYDVFIRVTHDAQSISKAAYDAHTLLVDGNRIAQQTVVNEMAAQTSDRVPVGRKKIGRGTPEQRKSIEKWGTLKAALTRVESWALAMDGGRYGGAFTTYLVKPVFDAISEYYAKRAEPLKALVEALRTLSGRSYIERSYCRTGVGRLRLPEQGGASPCNLAHR